MSNLFVFFIEEMSEYDWQQAVRLDKKDRVIFLTAKEGSMPYNLLPYIRGLKNEPELYPIAEQEPIGISFFLGTQSASNSGNCFIVTKKTTFDCLNDTEIESGSTNIVVRILKSIDEISGNAKQEAEENIKEPPKKAKEDSNENTGKEKPENNKSNNKSQETEADEKSNAQISSEASVLSSENETKNIPNSYPKVSKEFADRLLLYSTGSINLKTYKEVIGECVRNAQSDVLGSLEFQIKMNMGESFALKICPLLDEHLDELKELL